MARPKIYERFVDFFSFLPTAQFPGSAIETEFDRIKESLDETQTALSQIRRDDGALGNGLVGFDQLKQPEMTKWVADSAAAAVSATSAAASATAAAASAASVADAMTKGRERLTGPRTYYVAPAGSNANNGLAPSSPFQTVNHAITTALQALDTREHNVTVQLADGAYAGFSVPGKLFGTGLLRVVGNNAAPGNVVINSGVSVFGGANAYLSGMKIVHAIDWTHLIKVSGGANVQLGFMDYGSVGANANHIHVEASTVQLTQNYTISAGALRHWALSANANLISANLTVTVSGTPAFTQFAMAGSGAVADHWGMTFVGAATGQRYNIHSGAVINTNGKPATFLPGDAAGATATGGIYA